jgi:1-acyl-sn-glycerol-3-phosphate acyltransferase
MTEWSAGYEAIRTYVRFAFWLTHKRIVVTGRHQIPKGKPIIFAANHQNALMDPLAVSCTNSFQILWLARADIFKSKAARSFLKYIKMLPIYRIRDGKDNLSNNEQIFGQVIHTLENKQSIALFPEAAHSGKRQMLPHKKAIPRIALEAEEKNNFGLDLQIVPVGIFYSHYWWFNRTLIVQYGKPIAVDKYKDEYIESPQKAMLSLRDEIHEQLCPLIIQINSEKYYQEYEDIRQLAGKAYSRTRQFSKNRILRRFYAEQELIAKVEKIEINRPEEFEKIITETRSYFQAIRETLLTDEQVRKAGKAPLLVLLVRLIAAVFSFPLFAFGFLFNAIPFFIPRKIFRRKVKDMAFLSTFNFASGLILFPVFYLIETSLVFAFTDSGAISLLTFILMPYAGKIAFKLFLFYQDIWASLMSIFSNKALLKRMVKRRKEVIELVLGMIG